MLFSFVIHFITHVINKTAQGTIINKQTKMPYTIKSIRPLLNEFPPLQLGSNTFKASEILTTITTIEKDLFIKKMGVYYLRVGFLYVKNKELDNIVMGVILYYYYDTQYHCTDTQTQCKIVFNQIYLHSDNDVQNHEIKSRLDKMMEEINN